MIICRPQLVSRVEGHKLLGRDTAHLRAADVAFSGQAAGGLHRPVFRRAVDHVSNGVEDRQSFFRY